jgi:hypothetical protein
VNLEQAARILSLCDEGHTPAQIAAAMQLPAGSVYATLRVERPNRSRAPRRKTSGIPGQVLGLNAAGVAVGRIAGLLGISRTYVYRILATK